MDRRELLKVTAGMVWTVPVIDAVTLPVHGQASPPPMPPPPTQPPPTLPPEGCPVTVVYTGPNPVTISPSDPVTELAWVRANIYPDLVLGRRTENYDYPAWTANRAWAVVLLKAGTSHFVYVNVQVGDRLQTSGQDISHMSKFECPS
jgi:hypothetical protein